MADVRDIQSGTHYQVGETGSLEEWNGKLFIGKALGFTGMEVSLNRVPSGGGAPFLHAHREHEELYLFVSGTGQFQVDGHVFPVKAGTAVRVEPEGKRAWRNTGSDDLVVVVVQANRGTLTGQDGIRLEGAIPWND